MKNEAGAEHKRLGDAMWISAEELLAEGILISPRMISDHYRRALRTALEVPNDLSCLLFYKPAIEQSKSVYSWPSKLHSVR